jgi:hypothetical protein
MLAPTMSAPTLHPPDGYSLHVSLNTLRKRIASGQVTAERVHRPQGHVWRVYLDVDHPATEPAQHHASLHAAASSNTVQQPATALAQTEALTTLIQATVREAITPLVEVLERQAGEIAELREDRGRLTAELERAAGTVVALSDDGAAARTPESPPEAPTAVDTVTRPVCGRAPLLAVWERWYVVVPVLALLVALVLLFVPR